MKKFLWLLRWQFFFLLLPLRVQATTITAVSSSFADVNAAVSVAARGDTVIVPAGTSSWTSTLAITKGLTLLGAGRGNTVLQSSSTLIQIAPDATAIANEETIRVEGFTFDGNNSSLRMIEVDGAGVSSTKPFKNLAVGNNTFQNASTTTSGNGAITTFGQVRGCIFGNIFDRCDVILKILGNDDLTEFSNGHFPFAFGNSDNLFFENNTIMFSSAYSGQDSGWTETGQGARLVMRYNVWNMTNASYSELWDIHGFQNWPGNGQTGTMISEYYGNTVLGFASYRWINHRGGWGMYFDNQISGSGGAAIQVDQYGPADPSGSGCEGDVPGAYGSFNTEVTNTYVFNNTLNGKINPMVFGPLTDQCGIGENMNFWNYNSSFNGSAGIGRGTTAPSGNCSVGVGYWVASTPGPTTNAAIIQSGVFYQCQSPNVWTAIYTPYTYPHPLDDIAGGTTSGPSAVAGASPMTVLTNVNVQFIGSNSSSPAGLALTNYSWTFGDAGSSSLTNPVHAYVSPGTYTAVLRVVDSKSQTGSATMAITVTNGPSTNGVFYVSASGNDSNVGSLANPWKTIGKANSTVRAGQTVYIEAGTYNQGIAPINSGTRNAPIVFQNYGSDNVTINGNLTGITLNGNTWVVVSGINFTNVVAYMDWNAATNCTATNCLFIGQNGSSAYSGVWLHGSSQTNLITSCSFAYWGNEVSSEYGDEISIGDDTNPSDLTFYNRLENCTLSYAGHSLLNLRTGRQIIRGNRFHNEAWYNGYGHRCIISDTSNSSVIGGYNLIESNIISFAAPSYSSLANNGMDMRTRFNIVRRNYFYNNANSGLAMEGGSGASDQAIFNHIYNNTFYNNDVNPNSCGAAIGMQVYGSPFVVLTNSIFNNLMWKQAAAYWFNGGPTASQQIISNNWENAGDPKFVNITNAYTPTTLGLPNLAIQIISPCIDAGAFLTRITSSSGSGTSFTVADPYFFQAGMGGIQGDLIQLQGQTSTARITSISGNTLTVDSSLTWTNGQAAALSYSGSSPDIGAFENTFTSSGAPPPPSNLRIISAR